MKGKIIENLKVHVGTNMCGGATTMKRSQHKAEFRFYPESPVPMGVVVKWNGREQFIPFTNITHVDLADAPDEDEGGSPEQAKSPLKAVQTPKAPTKK